MADICILYAHEDRSVAKTLHDCLAPAYTVWWDDHIRVGDYRAEIETQITAARCVIPLWSAASRLSATVLDEVSFARSLGKHLLPVRLEKVAAPLGFGGLHTVDLFSWEGDPLREGYQELRRNLASVLGGSTVVQLRPAEWQIAEKTLKLPLFFFSISSFETALSPEAAVQAIALYRPESALFSAYDVYNAQDNVRNGALASLARYRSMGGTVALDSGNYEAARKRDATWKVHNFHEALGMADYDFAFSFERYQLKAQHLISPDASARRLSSTANSRLSR